MEDEVWKNIEGYEGIYQVSNKGFVRSKSNLNNDWRIMEESLMYGGHPKVFLSKNGIAKYRLVAPLVLETFVGKKPSEKHQALKINGRQEDVELKNLKWGTRKELSNLIKRNGNMAQGVILPQHKLSTQDVEEIKNELVNGFLTLTEIAETFGVSFKAINSIRQNKTWKHVPFPKGNINDYTFKECKFCKDQFKVNRFVFVGQPERYCSQECRKNQDVLFALGKSYQEHYGVFKGSCECCGENYEVDQSIRIDLDNKFYFSKKYCSQKCAKRKNYLDSIGKTYEEVYGIVEKDCEFCGQLFELGEDDYKGQKYCRSKDCDRERERLRSAKKRWNGKGYWDREGKNDKLQRNYT